MRIRQRRCVSATIVMGACSVAMMSQIPASTLEVRASGGTPFQTIQSAIDAAVPGTDNVLVRCGTYHENVLMRDQVSVAGEGTQCTVINGGANGSVVRLSNIGSATVLQGFTITNGRSTLGGGIHIIAGSPVVTRNVITGNVAVISGAYTGYGGGIRISSSATLSADPTALAATAPLITRNIIRANTAEAFGGGIEVTGDAGSRILNNLIVGNRAIQGGGALDIFQSFPTVSNNTILRNCPQGMGTACAQGGGGILLTLSGILDIANNVIAWNEAATGGGGVDQASSTTRFTSNDVYQNLPVNFAGVANPTGTNGNLSSEPRFEDEPGFNFNPRSDSLLVDAASSALSPTDDFRLRPRPLDGDADGVARSDIGAVENDGITRLTIAGESLSWDASTHPSATYNLYRGDVQTLRLTGIYTQDPGSVPGAARQCGLPTPTASDADVPASGRAFFYLSVVRYLVEGTLGFASSGAERPFTAGNRCP